MSSSWAGALPGWQRRSRHGCMACGSSCWRPRTRPSTRYAAKAYMPEALAALRRLGVPITAAHGAPLVGLRFVDGAQHVEARFPAGSGLGVRRSLLHQALVERAQEVGVAIHWATPVRAVTPSEVQSPRLRVAYRWLVAADGLHSAMRRWPGSTSSSSSVHVSAFNATIGWHPGRSLLRSTGTSRGRCISRPWVLRRCACVCSPPRGVRVFPISLPGFRKWRRSWRARPPRPPCVGRSPAPTDSRGSPGHGGPCGGCRGQRGRYHRGRPRARLPAGRAPRRSLGPEGPLPLCQRPP